MSEKPTTPDLNPDPITGEPGSHPVGTGIGSASAAAAGAAIGAIGGPIGAAVGGVIGAVTGAVIGHNVAEGANPTAERAYWEESYDKEPYYEDGETFTDYDPAYKLGYVRYSVYGDRTPEEAERELEKEWESSKEDSRLNWDKARLAARAGYERTKRPFDETP